MHKCKICGYVYRKQSGDVENGVNPDTKFEDLPARWVCPICGADKSHFIGQSLS